MADLAAACDALADVISLFRRMGFEFEPRLTVKFADARRKPAEGAASYGHADVASSLVVVYSSTHRQPWGQSWSPRLADSFLRHELAHIAVWRTPHSAAKRLAREWHEFIAYAVQFELMESDLRDAALANFPQVRPFTDLAAVNEFTYAMDPDVFAIAAYLTYRERGAENFLRGLLRGDIVPPPLSFPFPILPEAARPRSGEEWARGARRCFHSRSKTGETLVLARTPRSSVHLFAARAAGC